MTSGGTGQSGRNGLFGDLATALFGDQVRIAPPSWHWRARRAVTAIAATVVYAAVAALVVWTCVVAAVHLGRTL